MQASLVVVKTIMFHQKLKWRTWKQLTTTKNFTPRWIIIFWYLCKLDVNIHYGSYCIVENTWAWLLDKYKKVSEILHSIIKFPSEWSEMLSGELLHNFIYGIKTHGQEASLVVQPKKQYKYIERKKTQFSSSVVSYPILWQKWPYIPNLQEIVPVISEIQAA